MRLTADSITKTFEGLQALADVTVSIDEGEIVGVIGPNGSGKTTLINVISGVISPTEGRIRLGDESWTKRASQRVARCGIARTFQTTRLFREMTVAENVQVAASANPSTKGWIRPHRVSRDAIERLGLTPYADTVVSTLPYGLQRRVEIARAIAPRPRFLLLDEPAAGLNEAESDELLGTLLEFKRTLNFGMLLVDHDLRLIMRATDRICVLNDGALLCTGTPIEVRKNPDVIRAYIGGEPADGANGQTGEGRQE